MSIFEFYLRVLLWPQDSSPSFFVSGLAISEEVADLREYLIML
jgi:hypothetical protein